MGGDDKPVPATREAFSLERWSRLKREAARADPRPAPQIGRAVAPAAQETASTAASTPAAEPTALPDVESLNFDSDFTAFLGPRVDDGLKRRALKKLFSDPRFNVMDGLDVYIDDYTKPDPLAPDVARALADACSILGQPATPEREAGTGAATAAADEVSATETPALAHGQEDRVRDVAANVADPIDAPRDAGPPVERPVPQGPIEPRSTRGGSGA